MSNPTRKYPDRILFRRLFQEAEPYRLHLAGIFLLSLVAPPLALLIPLPLKLVVDSVLGEEPLPGFIEPLVPAATTQSPVALLIFCAVMLVAIGVFVRLQELGAWMLHTYTGEKLKLRFRARLLRHAQRLSLIYHDRKGTNDALFRIQYDTPSIESVLVKGLAPIGIAVLTLGGMVFITMRIDPILAAIALTIAPLLLIFIEVHRRRVRNQWSELKAVQSDTFSIAEETLSALRVVKAFGREEHHQDRYVDRANQGFRRHFRLAFLEGGFGLLVGGTISAGMAAALFVGGWRVLAGELSLGNLLIVMAYLTQLYTPLQAISKQVAQLQSGLASADRAFSLLDEQRDVPERPNARSIARARGEISFRNVGFDYEPGVPVLRDISFEVPAGARVGIAGTTGAGKTTLVGLLPRFYDPVRGAVFLDGIDLRDYRLRDLRAQFALVLQEPLLFSATIAENIAYARPDATEGEIAAAVRAAHAEEFIRALPDGYQTMVGERGMRLSGGERQRISLARAFLRDAPILLLDEPTSSVDVRTETTISAAMNELMKNRTTFLIAHRLSTLEFCDFVLHIERGRIARIVSPGEIAATVQES